MRWGIFYFVIGGLRLSRRCFIYIVVIVFRKRGVESNLFVLNFFDMVLGFIVYGDSFDYFLIL